MKIHIAPIIQASELLLLHGNENLILIEASNNAHSKLNFQEKHLDGAMYIDLNAQLAAIHANVAIGGRHPLPSLESFSNTLSNLGINKESHIVIYDDKNGSNAAARCWWMLKAAGHQKVQVLNGGFHSAEKVGYPTNSKMENPKPALPYQIAAWQLPLSSMIEVENVSQNEHYLVIDVRDAARYNGETEPIDLIAGHIPGAINVPFTENLDKDGLFLSPAVLKLKYEKILGSKKGENIIVHCGSGVTACHTLLAIAYANLEIPKLYVGSWSEWSRNNKTIATKN